MELYEDEIAACVTRAKELVVPLCRELSLPDEGFGELEWLSIVFSLEDMLGEDIDEQGNSITDAVAVVAELLFTRQLEGA